MSGIRASMVVASIFALCLAAAAAGITTADLVLTGEPAAGDDYATPKAMPDVDTQEAIPDYLPPRQHRYHNAVPGLRNRRGYHREYMYRDPVPGIADDVAEEFDFEAERQRLRAGKRAEYGVGDGEQTSLLDRFRRRQEPGTSLWQYEWREDDGSWTKVWPFGDTRKRAPRPEARARRSQEFMPGLKRFFRGPAYRNRSMEDLPPDVANPLPGDRGFRYHEREEYDGPWPWEVDEDAPAAGEPTETNLDADDLMRI